MSYAENVSHNKPFLKCAKIHIYQYVDRFGA